MTASGTFGYGEEFSDFIDIARIGGIIVKGTTLHKREGNPYPRMAETPSGMLNAVGLQNKGVDYFVEHIYPRIKDIQTNMIVNVSGSAIEDYVKTHFPGSTLTFFEDRDRSGYTFEQREGYQEMRRGLMSHKYDILIVKDFSRFSRRNSRGLVELEDLRDAGVRIISIGDNIDFPNDDDWLKIQFQFLVNEMPVTCLLYTSDAADE